MSACVCDSDYLRGAIYFTCVCVCVGERDLALIRLWQLVEKRFMISGNISPDNTRRYDTLTRSYFSRNYFKSLSFKKLLAPCPPRNFCCQLNLFHPHHYHKPQIFGSYISSFFVSGFMAGFYGSRVPGTPGAPPPPVGHAYPGVPPGPHRPSPWPSTIPGKFMSHG